MARILVISADASLADALRASPPLEGHEVETVPGNAAALHRLREEGFDVLVTSPDTSVDEDGAMVDEARHQRPGMRVVLLAPTRTPALVIEALRKRAFACFSVPFDIGELADMVARAAAEEQWKDGIEVLSAAPNWISVRVNCRMASAERLVNFVGELRSDLPEATRDPLMFAFREVLVNAMEHGGGFDPQQVVQVSAVRTARALVFHLKDPGPGFDPGTLPHAALAREDEPLAMSAAREAAGLRPGGFGLLIAHRVVDEIIYSERRNEVILIKHLR